MNRREFLKSIGYVSAASILPLSALVDEPETVDPLELEEKHPSLKWEGKLVPGEFTATTSAFFYQENKEFPNV